MKKEDKVEFELAWVHVRADRYDEAIELGSKVVGRSGSKTSKKLLSILWSFKSDALRDKDDWLGALNACEQALEIDPENRHALIQRGYILLTQERYLEAEQSLSKAVEKVQSADILTMLAASQVYTNPNAAIQSAKAALRLDPNWDEAGGVLSMAEAIVKD